MYRRFDVSDAGRNMEDVVQDSRFQDEYGCEQGFDDLEGNRQCEIDDVPHEGPIVFYWKNKYWNIIDECNLGYVGLHCYESDDATNWTYNSTILNKPGLRPDDFDQGRHCDVVVIGDRAFIFYFTHPGRTYKMDGMEVEENTWNYHRASIQIAELEYVDGKIVCDRDKYAKKVPSPIERKKK